MKKVIKGILIIIVIVSLSFGFYSFNQWFFKNKSLSFKEEENKNVAEEVLKGLSNDTNDEKILDKKDTDTEISISKKMIKANVEYYCEKEEEKLEGDKCISYLETFPYYIVIDEQKSDLMCKDGYELKEDKCLKEVRLPAKEKYSCPQGYVVEDEMFCKEN